MSFLVFIICMLFAIFAGMVLDRLLIKATKEPCKHSNLIFDDKSEAEAVVKTLKSFYSDNGTVRVYDLNLVTGIGTHDGDFEYGWKNLCGFKIVEDEDHRYILMVPKPQLLEK